MGTRKFKTFKNVAAVSNYHVSLTKKELKDFETDVENIQKTLNTHEGRNLGLGSKSIDSLMLFMTTIAQSKKKKFEIFSAIMFGFGLYISKLIISKHGGALIRDANTDFIDVIVQYGESGSYQIFKPHQLIINIFNGSDDDVNAYLCMIDDIMALDQEKLLQMDILLKSQNYN